MSNHSTNRDPESPHRRSQISKLLLVDDSDIMLRHVSGLLEGILVGKKVQVETAGSFLEGLEKFAQSKPQAVLVDFVLGQSETGLSLIEAFFSLAKVSDKPLAALLTKGDLPHEDALKANALGIQVFQKPSMGKEQLFLKKITDWLQNTHQ